MRVPVTVRDTLFLRQMGVVITDIPSQEVVAALSDSIEYPLRMMVWGPLTVGVHYDKPVRAFTVRGPDLLRTARDYSLRDLYTFVCDRAVTKGNLRDQLNRNYANHDAYSAPLLSPEGIIAYSLTRKPIDMLSDDALVCARQLAGWGYQRGMERVLYVIGPAAVLVEGLTLMDPNARLEFANEQEVENFALIHELGPTAYYLGVPANYNPATLRFTMFFLE